MPITAVAAILLTQGTYTFKYAPKIGTTIKYRMKSSTEAGPGGKTDTSAIITQKVLSFNGKAYKVESTYSDVRMTSTSPMAKDEMGKQAKELNGKKFTMMIGTNGSISAGKTGDKMIDGMMSSSGLSQMTYPTRPMKLGDTWKMDVDMTKMLAGGFAASGMKSKVNGKIDNVFKFLSINRGSATIGSIMKGTVDVEFGAPKGSPKGTPTAFKMKMSIDAKGTNIVDAATGLLQSMKTNQVMNMSVMGQQVPMKVMMEMTRI
jgi:hypothetical protein